MSGGPKFLINGFDIRVSDGIWWVYDARTGLAATCGDGQLVFSAIYQDVVDWCLGRPSRIGQ